MQKEFAVLRFVAVSTWFIVAAGNRAMRERKPMGMIVEFQAALETTGWRMDKSLPVCLRTIIAKPTITAVDARSGAMLVDPAMPLIVDEEALPAVPALDLFSFALSHFFHGSFLV